MKYIIISLKHGTGVKPCFWKANDAGYTNYPFNAGIYDEEQVKARPDYYNNGYGSVAIPLTEEAMQKLGFKCSFDEKAVVHFFQPSKG
jgi:hypothetical protein